MVDPGRRCGHPGCEDKVFANKRDRDNHVRNKHRPLLHQCTLIKSTGNACRFRCATKQQLTKHITVVHTPHTEKPLACEYSGCTSRYVKKDDLQRHIVRCHTAEEDKAYICPVPECQKKFSIAGTFNRHLKRHQRNEAKLELKSTTTVADADSRSQPEAQISRLRKSARTRRAFREIEDGDIGEFKDEFDEEMFEAVKAYNAATIAKYPDRPLILEEGRWCIGEDTSGDVRSCPYGAVISNETSQLAQFNEQLKLLPRCVYCKRTRETLAFETLVEEKDKLYPGLCLHDWSCMEPQREGSKWCSKHIQMAEAIRAARSDSSPGSDTWRILGRKRYDASAAQGVCRHITTSIGMWNYLEEVKGKQFLRSNWRHLKEMEQNQSDILFYIDTEFAGEVLVEVGIINAAGAVIVDSVVSHDKSWRQLHEEGRGDTKFLMELQKTKFQWDQNWNLPPSTKTLNARELAGILLNARTNHPNARFIEYSRGNLDLRHLRRFLHDNGGLDWVLEDHIGFGMYWLWYDKLPGFWWLSQPNIFWLVHPNHPLARQAHRAMVDTLKLRILFQDIIADSAG